MFPVTPVKFRYWETSNKYFMHQASRERQAAGNKGEGREEFLGRESWGCCEDQPGCSS